MNTFSDTLRRWMGISRLYAPLITNVIALIWLDRVLERLEFETFMLQPGA